MYSLGSASQKEQRTLVPTESPFNHHYLLFSTQGHVEGSKNVHGNGRRIWSG